MALEPSQYRRLDEVSAPALGAPHEDVSAALAHGFDGDRSLLATPATPVA
ncbi:hypothetical protein [Nocardioides bruguierae]|uniref:Uncharacterized protein n=1 Tax=Nocardioides bruguierae TaxID=2945102 RepID=A0A9X2IG49_9ACTN|nr:hypothetical protein [Nocardioides bruguierae]MCM0621997.1 hypothetical protein [Nocardioides bruguierae]